MLINKSELKQYNLFDNLPDNFKNVGEREFFVFYYLPNEENLFIDYYEDEIVKDINVSLYRGISEKSRRYGLAIPMQIGFFKGEEFETKNGLFYLFLRTFCNHDDVDNFYRSIKKQDEVTDLNISTNASNKIFCSEDFNKILGYFCPSKLQSIITVYDMVSCAIKGRLGKKLYGDLIKKVVNMITYNGGVLPEVGGYMRYMVIGEHANLTEEQNKKLVEAELLLRSLQRPNDIYSQTGWYFSNNDGKWRTNISDDEAYIKQEFLVEHNGMKLFVPPNNNMTIDNILQLIQEPDRLYAYSYNGKLSDVLHHPTLYQRYPDLANMPLIYYFSEDKNLQVGGESYYFSENKRGGYILIYGSKMAGDSLSILLHETQHAIQRIEGFARGGNEFFAKFVVSLGASNVRMVFASINKLENIFKQKIYNEETRTDLIRILRETQKPNINPYVRKVLEMLEDNTQWEISLSSIIFYLIVIVADSREYANNDIVIYLESKLGYVAIDLFSNINDGYEKAIGFMKKLKDEAVRDEDIDKILFAGYLNLYGETESRSVQISRFVTSEYKNYFYLTEWENTPLKQLVVIDGVDTVLDIESIKGACEEKDGEYVLHFKRQSNLTPFLHELGHIVHDCLVELGFGDAIYECYSKNLKFDDESEYFVSRFLGYIRNNVHDEEIEKDLRMDLKIKDDEDMNKIFDKFFRDTEYDDRINFLRYMIETPL